MRVRVLLHCALYGRRVHYAVVAPQRNLTVIHILRVMCICWVASGCLPTSPSEEDDFLRNRELWEASRPTTYEFIFQRSSCECLPEWTIAMKIVVNEGQIQSVASLSSGEEISGVTHRAQTIGELFAEIERALDQGAYHVDVTYDRQLGYPTSIFINQDQQHVDDEVSYTARDLRVVD